MSLLQVCTACRFPTHIIVWVRQQTAARTGRHPVADIRSRQGAYLVAKAEETARTHGADRLTLHAQERVEGFYKSLGYRDMGIHDQDEGCPHMWMDKPLTVGTGNKAEDQAS